METGLAPPTVSVTFCDGGATAPATASMKAPLIVPPSSPKPFSPPPYSSPSLQVVPMAPCTVSGGMGLAATADIHPGTLLLEESPLALLDPPTRRRDLQIMLGCRKFSSIDMKAQPDQIREQVQRLVLEDLVEKRTPEEDRRRLFALSDRRSELTGRPKTLWGVWETNSLPVGSYRVSAVFSTISRINHSCRPNASLRWKQEEGRMQVRATAPIRAGEEVTISYMGTFSSRACRRQMLEDRFRFICGCPACSTPFEAEAEDDDRRRIRIDEMSQRFAQGMRTISAAVLASGS